MKTFLGIDQGGSKTNAIVCDCNGNILGLGTGDGACHSTTGMQSAMDAIETATKLALLESKTKREDIVIVAAGMTGLDWKHEYPMLTQALAQKFPQATIKVVNDCLIALRAESKTTSGAILCAGSGLNCAVKKDGQTELVYGFYINEGLQGGAAIGRKALRAVIDASIGLVGDTLLTQLILGHFRAADADELLFREVTGDVTTKDYLSLPLIVEQAAAANDVVALMLLSDYGTEVARYVIEGMRKLQLLDKSIDIILSGSIFKCKVPVLQEAVTLQIHRHAINARVVPAIFEPIVGAMLLALDIEYGKTPDSVYSNLEQYSQMHRIKRL